MTETRRFGDPIHAESPLAYKYIGCWAKCSKGIRGLITGIGRTSYAMVFTGVDELGRLWCSRVPHLIAPPAIVFAPEDGDDFAGKGTST